MPGQPLNTCQACLNPAAAAVESSRALERRFAELAEERGVLAAALEEVQARAASLEHELTHLTGQQNLNQRIQYHKKVGAVGSRQQDWVGSMQ